MGKSYLDDVEFLKPKFPDYLFFSFFMIGILFQIHYFKCIPLWLTLYLHDGNLYYHRPVFNYAPAQSIDIMYHNIDDLQHVSIR